ncbi:MAG: alpha/beta hydrolase [Rikenellaceae bacterium]|nr:alpha/beta hydrolase [Rikenellaceae bacterium]
MKKLMLLFFLLPAFTAHGQDITGKWYGRLEIGPTQLRIHIDLAQNPEGWSVRLQSPDQSQVWVNGLAEVSDDSLKVHVPQWQFNYYGRIASEERIEGTFYQFQHTAPLNLSRVARPQEPRPPFDYGMEEVVFRNEKAGINLAGTLTLPASEDAPYPAVVLVTGSGPQDRDESLAGHKPFWVIADYLTRHGIAVLRYDDRGFAQSEGNFAQSTTFDFTEDAVAGIDYLRTRPEIAPQKIGLAGHSEGGLIAFIAASGQKPNFILSLAGPGVSGKEILARQIADMSRVHHTPEFYVKTQDALIRDALEWMTTLEDSAQRKEKVAELFQGTPLESQTEDWYAQMSSVWMSTFLRTDPAEFFPTVHCPVWAAIGEKDLQVSAKPNLEAIRQGLSHNPKVTIQEYPGLNYLFQTAITGAPEEYAQIEETFNEVVLKDMTDWILAVTAESSDLPE